MYLSESMLKLGQERSVIREIFEYGLKRKQEIGEEKVFDFSLGNPSLPAPPQVQETLSRLIKEVPAEKLHAYTPGSGRPSSKKAIADYIRNTFAAEASGDLVYITCGAAASLTISFHALLKENEEVITFAPYFPEYKVFVEKAGGNLLALDTSSNDFLPKLDELEKAIQPKTKAVLLNSPNNPSGAIYPESSIQAIADLLTRKQEEYGHPIFIISDEPYRELSYGKEVPFIPNYYDNTLVNYSYSKSLSLAGERIGYIFVSPKADKAKDIYAAINGAGRALGFVCAPSLFQMLIEESQGLTADFSVYQKNRDLLYAHLSRIGFNCTQADGAFYLFMKSPIADAQAFCEKAKEYELLLVPSDSFGCQGYVRIAYCVSTQQIKNSLAAFSKLAKFYQLENLV